MKVVLGLMCLSILVVNRNYYSSVGVHDHSYYSDDFRDAGPLGYAGENGMGAFQAQLAVFLFGLASFAKRFLKVGLWALAYTCLYCLLFTFSRGGYVGFIIGIVVLGVLKERKLLIVLTVILLGAGTFLPNAVIQRVLMTYQDGQVDPSATERIDLWQDAAQVIREDPMLGTGFDTYKFMGRIAGFGDTHNYYVKVLLEMGIVGLVIFAWMLRSAVKLAWDLFRNAKEPLLSALGCALFSTLACALVVNLFGDRWSFLQVNGFLWVLLGLGARGLFLTKQRQEVSEITPEELPDRIVRAEASRA
jgi:O-antigen ligase